MAKVDFNSLTRDIVSVDLIKSTFYLCGSCVLLGSLTTRYPGLEVQPMPDSGKVCGELESSYFVLYSNGDTDRHTTNDKIVEPCSNAADGYIDAKKLKHEG